MIFRLQYCNKFGDVARVDIETPNGSGVEEIRGTGNPFQLQYKTEATDKRGRFMTSSAEINIYENDLFNIDTLKTSSETDIKVSFYINNALTWQGFVIPDFFSKDIGKNSVVSMTASDRINTLKSVTLPNTDDNIRIRDVTQLCLAKTGLALPLLTMADFTSERGLPFFNTYIQAQRLYDGKGKPVNCYDILESILILSNSQIVQRKGTWQIVNKYQLEEGVGKIYSSNPYLLDWESEFHNFDFVRRGARRTITPVASSVGVMHEYGGSKRYPTNYNFRYSAQGWSGRNGFSYDRDGRNIDSFTKSGYTYTPNYGIVTNDYHIMINSVADVYAEDYANTQAYFKSSEHAIVQSGRKATVNFEINAVAPFAQYRFGFTFTSTTLNYAVVASNGVETLFLNPEGKFTATGNRIRTLSFKGALSVPDGIVDAVTADANINGVLEIDSGDVSDYSIHVRLYGIEHAGTPIAVNFAKFSVTTEKEVAQGTLYKTTTDGENFTKEHKDETTIFGDYLTNGLNGYFYDYPSDDTSSIFQDETKTQIWTAPNESVARPLLQQVTRQKARIFSVAHDIIRGDIDVKNFDPLAIFKDCNNKEYVVVSAEFDFLRSVASVEIEEIAYKNIDRRDYIYSYFGDEDN